MLLQIDVNNVKSKLFLELLNLFKKDEMIYDYKILEDKTDDFDKDILADLQGIGAALSDAKKGLGYKTSKTVQIKDL